MAKRINDAIGVAVETLVNAGIFNGFVDIDSRLYVDPVLLKRSQSCEMRDAFNTFKRHSANVCRLLKSSQQEDDPMWRQAEKMLTFREKPIMALGYAVDGIQGSAVGRDLARRLTKTAKQIIEAGVVDPTIFELVGLLETGIGPDRISDMTVAIIFEHILDYSARMAKELGIETTLFEGRKVPRHAETAKAVLVLPEDILTSLPVALDWENRDWIFQHNEALRQKVNPEIGETWRQATRVKKEDLRNVIFRVPALIEDAATIYKTKTGKKYNFAEDPQGELAWSLLAQSYVASYPLSLLEAQLDAPDKVLAVVRMICAKFASLVEVNGLWEAFWHNGKLRHERVAQLTFYGVADAYCEANNIDLSREPNGGRGPVDFKYSIGYHARVTVEVKYSTNTHLWHGWEKQLPRYNQAERTHNSIYLIIRTSEREKTINKIRDSAFASRARGERVPEVIVIDGRPSMSASRA